MQHSLASTQSSFALVSKCLGHRPASYSSCVFIYSEVCFIRTTSTSQLYVIHLFSSLGEYFQSPLPLTDCLQLLCRIATILGLPFAALGLYYQ